MNLVALRLLAVLAAAAALALGGCGGGGGGDSTSTTAEKGTTTTGSSSQGQSGDAKGTEGTTTGSSANGLALGSPADVPRSDGGDNSIQDYGSEASTADRAAAGRALQDYYDALGTGDTESACALLTSRTREGIQQTLEQLQGQAGGQLPTTCAQILKLTVGRGQPSRLLRPEVLLSLRRQGDDAFLIYKAGDGKVYSIAMKDESGDWRVGGVSASALAT